MSSTTRGRPPLPPSHSSSSIATASSNEGLTTLKPSPSVTSLTSSRHNPQVEKTLVETRRRLEQERPQPEPRPRRRLASFGGVGCTGSLSPFTGLGAYNQNNNGNKPGGPGGGELSVHLSSSLGSRGSTGSLRISPQSSGRSTPLTGLGPTHLQHVRDQMVVALQRLKELEEQVKTIPVLQVKIAVLQEEKRQMASQFKNQNEWDLSDAFRKRAYSTGSPECFQKVSETENEVNTDAGLQSVMGLGACSGLKEFKQLSEEMQALERTIKGGRLLPRHGQLYSTPHGKSVKSVAVGTEEDVFVLSKPSRGNQDASVGTELIETRSVATRVSEVNLGSIAEGDAEPDGQQGVVAVLQERICQLEAELKEAALQTEMSRLKLELQAAGARNRVDKASTAKPSTESASCEAKVHTRSQGVGNHTVLLDASTGGSAEVKVCTVGVSCRPELHSVSTGPDEPMSHWEVRPHVGSRDQCVGTHVDTSTKAVETVMEVCEAGTNTDVRMQSLGCGKEGVEYSSVACGDCSVDVTVVEAKQVVSHGMATDPVIGVNLGIMASPQTASQRTNTELNSVSRFTSTSHAFSTNSSTNTVLNTQEKHTNTAQAVTRTVSVGGRVQDVQGGPETRSVAVGTTAWAGGALKQRPASVAKAATRDAGVGMTNIKENFLVGLKTRNMACGPSHLPDPNRTRSVGVGEGKIRDLSNPSQTPAQTSQDAIQSKWDAELNLYIERMQRLLKEQQDVPQESYCELGKAFIQQQSRNITPKLVSTLSSINTAMRHRETGVHLPESQPEDYRQQVQSMSCPPNEVSHLGCNDSEVKRKIQMIEQHASVLQDRPANACMLRSIMKKRDGEQGCSSNRKSLKFMGVTAGLDPVSASCGSSSCEDTAATEEDWNRSKKWRDVPGLPSHLGPAGQGKAASNAQPKFKLSEKMISACHALKTHLNDDTALSSRELRSCLHTLQQEWFRVSSQKAAVRELVEDYMSAFRLISPSVLQHVANMADGNGNTALHYSVSHSNFHIVKNILDAEVCNVNQQNQAGYTPIMLAALAAVESPEDMGVVEELFRRGDVNAKASQAGQTALMLAVSHGRMDMVQALLAQGAEVNLQDDEGSTALMCASEHGHADLVKLLLAQPGCNATLSDSDESTALSIALEAGHKDIAVLLYAHVNFSKGQHGGPARLGGRSLPLCSGERSIFE